MTQRREKRSDQLKHGDSGVGFPYSDQDKRREPGTGLVHVELPSEPPELTSRAARALLRIIRKAYAQRTES